MQRSLLPALLLVALSASPAFSQDASFERFGVGCSSSAGIPSLDAAEDSLPRIGETFAAQFSNLPASASPFGLIGLVGLSRTQWAGVPLPLDLSPFGITGCTLDVSVLRANSLFVDGGSGSAGWTLHVANEPGLLGVQFYMQGLVVDPSANAAGLVLSNAAEGVIGVNSGPMATIIFPTKVSATDARSIIVRGTASDPSGVAEVRVNGYLAASGDGFANWQVKVPLERGVTDLVVATVDRLGLANHEAAQARIASQAEMSWASAIALDLARNRVLVLVGASIMEIDLTTGNREVFSGRGIGAGPELTASVAIALDRSRNRALITTYWGEAIHTVDLTTGDRSILSDSNTGTGVSLGRARSLAVDSMFAYVVSGGGSPGGELKKIDLATGDRFLVSDSRTGTGQGFFNPLGVVIDGDRAIVRDGAFRPEMGRIVSGSFRAVDLQSGDRSSVSGFHFLRILHDSSGAKFAINGSLALVLEPNRTEIVAVDLVTGDSTVFSDSTRGSGPNLENATAIAAEGNFAVVVDAGARAIVVVDFPSGDRRHLSRFGVGTGVDLGSPRIAALDSSRAIVLDSVGRSIKAVDLKTGFRSLISDELVSNSLSLSPKGFALDGDQAYVTTGNIVSTLISVNLVTDERKIVSGRDRGTGPLIKTALGVAIEGGLALVATGFDLRILSMDLATGNRTVLSGPGVGSGSDIWPTKLVVDGSRLIVIDATGPAIVAVDLQSGDRTILADSILGVDPTLYLTALTKHGSQLLVGTSGSLLSLDLETGNHTVLSGQRSAIPGDIRGSGPIPSITGIVVDGSIAFVGDSRRRGIMAIDMVTGERVIFSQ